MDSNVYSLQERMVIFPGWLQVFVESVIVGSYTVLLFLVIQQVFYSTDWNLFLFVLGFCKHAFGYLLGVQGFYCRYGYACQTIKMKKKQNAKKPLDNVLNKTVESVLEGLVFVVVGNMVFISLTTNRLYVVFATGCLLHIFSEIVGLHTYFCENGCGSFS